MADSEPNQEKQPLSTQPPFWQSAPAIEFICWVIVALAPMLYLVNGPPVTYDQAVMQISLVALATIGGFSMRLVNVRHALQWRELLAQEISKNSDG